MRATAAVLRDPTAPYAIEEIDLPAPGPGQLLVRIVSAGICHTDSLLRSRGASSLPVIAGHEGAGVVEAVGPGVSHLAAGDHVVLSYDYCGECQNCESSNTPYCDTFMARNLFGHPLDGSPGATDLAGTSIGSRWFGQSSFANYAIATVHNAVVVDRAVDLELLGPLGCGIQTGAGSVLLALGVEPGTSLAVFGAGAVGLAAVMAGRVAGASTIVAVDVHEQRLDLALSLGATHAIVAKEPGELAAEVQAVTGGGAQYALDTTSVPGVINAAISSLRLTGTCGLVGAGGSEVSLHPSGLFGKTITGIFEGNAVPQRFIPRLIELWQAGRFPFDRLIETFPLAAINDAEQASLDGRVVKPVLLPASTERATGA
jgi:aryl-alcohol dehydrogenase